MTIAFDQPDKHYANGLPIKVAPNNPLAYKARAYATEAHRGQVRKYTREPYIVHPKAVADLVRETRHTEEMLAAAYLHDVVEDCPSVTHADIHAAFGYEVHHLVYWLTKPSQPWDGNRAARKALDLAHLAKAPVDAQTIKLADIIDNSTSFIKHDPTFWFDVYRAEKLAQLEVCRCADPVLWRRAWILCNGEAAVVERMAA